MAEKGSTLSKTEEEKGADKTEREKAICKSGEITKTPARAKQ